MPELSPVGQKLVGGPTLVIATNRRRRKATAWMPLAQEAHELRVDGQTIISPEQHAQMGSGIVPDAVNAFEHLVQLAGLAVESFDRRKVEPASGDVAAESVHPLGAITESGDRAQLA